MEVKEEITVETSVPIPLSPTLKDDHKVADLELKIKELNEKLENERIKQNEIENENKNLKKILNDLSPTKVNSNSNNSNSSNDNEILSTTTTTTTTTTTSTSIQHQALEETISKFEDQVNQLKVCLTKRMPSGSSPVISKHSLSMSNANKINDIPSVDQNKILQTKIGAFEQKFNSIKSILLDISSLNASGSNSQDGEQSSSSTITATSKPIDIPTPSGSSGGSNASISGGSATSSSITTTNSVISSSNTSTDIIVDSGSNNSSFGSIIKPKSISPTISTFDHSTNEQRIIKEIAIVNEINQIDKEINEIRKQIEEQKEKENVNNNSNSDIKNIIVKVPSIANEVSSFPDVPSNFPIINISESTVSSNGSGFITPTTINIAQLHRDSNNNISIIEEYNENDSKSFEEDNINVKVIALNDIIKEGNLKKKGGGEGGRRSWKTRWFKLKNDSLAYFKKRKDIKPQGIINLRTAKVEKHSGKPFGIVILSGVSIKGLTRDYLLMAESRREQDEWISIISETIEKLQPPKSKEICLTSSLPVLLPPNHISNGSTSLSQSTSNLLKLNSNSTLTHPTQNSPPI